jgi:hypothetical protein
MKQYSLDAISSKEKSLLSQHPRRPRGFSKHVFVYKAASPTSRTQLHAKKSSELLPSLPILLISSPQLIGLMRQERGNAGLRSFTIAGI